MSKKSVAVQFQSIAQMEEIFKRMSISEYIISDEDDTMAEAEVTEAQFDELCKMEEVVYASEL
ncbi:MAG TPA: hypothetical protein VIH30_10480 [Aquirhabdus sp.]